MPPNSYQLAFPDEPDFSFLTFPIPPMTPLRFPLSLALLVLLLSAFALTGCDSGTDDDPDPAGFPGDARLLGMWAEPASDGYQDFAHFEYNEASEVLRVRLWEHDINAGCFDGAEVQPIAAEYITETTINADGGIDLITYSFSDGGNTLTFDSEDSEDGPQVLTRSSRTPESLTPECVDAPAFPGDPALLGMWAEPSDGDYQDFFHFEHDEEAGALRFRIWEHDLAAGCFLVGADYEIPLAFVSTTTFRDEDGDLIPYAVSGSELDVFFGLSLIRNDRVPDSMLPECPANP